MYDITKLIEKHNEIKSFKTISTIYKLYWLQDYIKSTKCIFYFNQYIYYLSGITWYTWKALRIPSL